MGRKQTPRRITPDDIKLLIRIPDELKRFFADKQIRHRKLYCRYCGHRRDAGNVVHNI